MDSNMECSVGPCSKRW